MAKVVTGATPKAANPEHFGDAAPFLTPSDIPGRQKSITTSRFLSPAGAEAFNTKLIPKGTPCFVAIGSTIGKTCVAPAQALTNQQIHATIPDPSEADGDFLYYALTHYGESLRQIAGGSATPILKKTSFEDFTIPVPRLEEQKRIAQVLSALDDKIDCNKRLAKTLEEIAATLFKARFIDFVGREELTDSELGPIPRGWSVSSIYDFAAVTYGRPFKSDLFNDEEGIPLIRIRDLASSEPGVRTREVRGDGRIIVAEDIVVGMDGEFRAHAWAGPDSWLNQRVCAFDPHESVSRVFVLEAIKRPLAFFEATKSGTTVIHLGKGDIDTFRVISPPTSVMQEFSRQADPSLKAAIARQMETRTLAAILGALLPRLISGSLRVDPGQDEAMIA